VCGIRNGLKKRTKKISCSVVMRRGVTPCTLPRIFQEGVYPLPLRDRKRGVPSPPCAGQRGGDPPSASCVFLCFFSMFSSEDGSLVRQKREGRWPPTPPKNFSGGGIPPPPKGSKEGGTLPPHVPGKEGVTPLPLHVFCSGFFSRFPSENVPLVR